jgi:transcriptional regulator with XRE-family HTH domain
MNDIMERIEKLRVKKRATQYKVCKDLKISPSTYNTWLKEDRIPKADRLKVIAEYFGVSLEYLATGKETASNDGGLTIKDERDIKQALEDFKNRLSTAGVMYDEPIDEDSQAAILAAVELAERTARIAAKEKFTPKKYKK